MYSEGTVAAGIKLTLEVKQ